MSNEIWKDVVGFEGLYKISNYGRIIACERKIHREKYGSYTIPQKFLKPTYDKDNYLKTAFRNREGERFYFRVHRVVAEAFLPNENNLPEINHKDGVKDNNYVGNLEWCTTKYNINYSYNKLGRKGQNGGMNRRVQKINPKTLEVISEYESIREASESVGSKSTAINNCLNGRTKTSFGYIWRFVDEGVSTIENTSLDGSE